MNRARFAVLFLAIAVLSLQSARADEPVLKWAWQAQSHLYAPPLVADLHPSPGREVLISDADARMLRCVSAEGEELWSYDGGWTRRLTSSAALSHSARPGKRTLAIGNPDGWLHCIDGATGEGLWKRDVGRVEWGSVLWADLTGDGRDELVAGTRDRGIAALDADGNLLWTYNGEDGGAELGIQGPIAASALDDSGRVFVFAAGQWGPVCVTAQGRLRWSAQFEHNFATGVIAADADGDGKPELYAMSQNDPYLFSFDAQNGAERWRFPLLGEGDVYPGSGLAVGRVTGGGANIVFGDSQGHVYCLSSGGALEWLFITRKPAHVAVTLGDVDGDGRVDVLAASGDHRLYCLDDRGGLQWYYKANRRLIAPPTLTDLDGGGTTDILFGGSDGVLRCLTLGGRYDPARMPWPSRRFDAAQTGSQFAWDTAGPPDATETAELLPFGGFDAPKLAPPSEAYPQGSGLHEARVSRPRGWYLVSDPSGAAEWKRDDDDPHAGAAALRVTPAGAPVALASDSAPLDGVQAVRASVMAQGRGAAAARLEWFGAGGVSGAIDLAPAGEDGAWTQLEARLAPVPPAARWIRLVLIAEPGHGPVRWDTARLEATRRTPAELTVLVNQVGYDRGAPKRFTVQANFREDGARFAVVDSGGAAVYDAPLEYAGRISGHYGNDWGNHYWRGDLSVFNQPGSYRIRVTVGGAEAESWPFEIARNLLWNATARPAYRFFYYQRCGMAIPGYYEACHLDDAIDPETGLQYDVRGGWHDAGDYNKYHNAPYVHGLAVAYGRCRELFAAQAASSVAVDPFLEEILWGADHSRKMIAEDGSARGPITSGYGFWGPPHLETDNVPGTGDERPMAGGASGHDPSQHLAAMARTAGLAPSAEPYIEAAKRAMAWSLEHNRRGPLQFAAAVDLFAVTGDSEWEELARDLFPQITPETAAAVLEFDAAFGEDHGAAVRDALVAEAERMLSVSANPFGVYTFGPPGNPNFFNTPTEQVNWNVGTNSQLLNAAARAAFAYELEPDPRYLEFVYDQFNWVLGNNPFNISLMEGVGSAFAPSYHHRYTFAGVPRGAVPGGVVNGITWRAPGDDQPFFDMSGLDIPRYESNEVWLPHNTAYLEALTRLMQAAGGAD